jgi:hypothetical protein
MVASYETILRSTGPAVMKEAISLSIALLRMTPARG